jgi:hypothetical protein
MAGQERHSWIQTSLFSVQPACAVTEQMLWQNESSHTAERPSASGACPRSQRWQQQAPRPPPSTLVARGLCDKPGRLSVCKQTQAGWTFQLAWTGISLSMSSRGSRHMAHRQGGAEQEGGEREVVLVCIQPGTTSHGPSKHLNKTAQNQQAQYSSTHTAASTANEDERSPSKRPARGSSLQTQCSTSPSGGQT